MDIVQKKNLKNPSALTGILGKAAELVPLTNTLLPTIQNILGL